MYIYYMYKRLWTEHTPITDIRSRNRMLPAPQKPCAILPFQSSPFTDFFLLQLYCLILFVGLNTFLISSYSLNYKVQMNENWRGKASHSVAQGLQQFWKPTTVKGFPMKGRDCGPTAPSAGDQKLRGKASHFFSEFWGLTWVLGFELLQT